MLFKVEFSMFEVLLIKWVTRFKDKYELIVIDEHWTQKNSDIFPKTK